MNFAAMLIRTASVPNVANKASNMVSLSIER